MRANSLSVSLVRSPRIVTFVVYYSEIGATARSLSLSLTSLSQFFMNRVEPTMFIISSDRRRRRRRSSGVVVARAGFKWRKPTWSIKRTFSLPRSLARARRSQQSHALWRKLFTFCHG